MTDTKPLLIILHEILNYKVCFTYLLMEALRSNNNYYLSFFNVASQVSPVFHNGGGQELLAIKLLMTYVH